MRIFTFEDLEVFQRAYRISLEVHRASLKFPEVERHVLADQNPPREQIDLREYCRRFRQTAKIER